MKKPIITSYVAKKRFELIVKNLKIFERKTPKEKINVLDVGCGDGYFTQRLRKRGYKVLGIDINTPETASWMHSYPDYVMDVRNMTFKDNSFDVVIALEVIEHVPCISEINRVLKPAGIFICSTPSPNTDWMRHIAVFLGLLEGQDFEHHDNIIDLKEAPMKLMSYKKMFFGASQFGVLMKKV